MSLPLEGIKIVDLSNYVAAPSAARLLCDLGADVIKIEAFGGDVWREVSKSSTGTDDSENPMFDVLNMGKKSICLNVKDEKGHEILMRMLADADVFITNTRAKSLAKLGLDSKTLTEKFPRLVYCSMDGYGDKGPDANTPGFDSQAFWTRSGFLLDMAEANSGYPVCSPTGIGDCVTGLILTTGIMTALFNREKTGRGDIIKTSLYSAAIWTMNSMVLRTQPQYCKIPFPRTSVQEGSLTRKYKCRDDKWFVIHVLDYKKDAHKVYDLLGISEKVKELGIVDSATRLKHNAELAELCEQAFLTNDSSYWDRIFKEADLVSGTMPHFSEVATDEQAWANDFLEEFTFRSGNTCAMPRTPLRMASVPLVPSRPAPLPGEQTDEILRTYGFGEDEILDMKNHGVVS